MVSSTKEIREEVHPASDRGRHRQLVRILKQRAAEVASFFKPSSMTAISAMSPGDKFDERNHSDERHRRHSDIKTDMERNVLRRRGYKHLN
ncbi:hypothetical protein H2248_000240 [Termitomyces sp. 'cryptogamus']|nr:hypothetical protein H2248_000240 [Termitomyces sp. 'cryptogamus']